MKFFENLLKKWQKLLVINKRVTEIPPALFQLLMIIIKQINLIITFNT